MYLEEVEKEVVNLRKENVRLREELDALKEENRMVGFHPRTIVSQSHFYQLRNSIPGGNGGVMNALRNTVFGSTKAQATSGVLIMAILFSIGFMFQSHLFMSPLSGVAPAVTQTRGARVVTLGNYESTSLDKDLIGLLQNQDMPTEVPHPHTSSHLG